MVISKRLSNKLISAFFIVLLIFSGCFILFTYFSAPVFLQELNQKLNQGLAANIVKEKKLMLDNQVNQKALKAVLNGLMVVNPMIEVYITDQQGKILAYSAPKDAVKQTHINMSAVKEFIDKKIERPIHGTDPRHLSRSKVFSAAPIKHKDTIQGYLYVVLGGQEYDSNVQLIESSYSVKLWSYTIIVSLIIALIAGWFIFRFITRRIEQLSNGIDEFKQNDFKQPIDLPTRFNHNGDEIDRLGATCQEMSDRIQKLILELKQNDDSRRELVANVSHDLRTPLASLKGYLETLLLKSDSLNDEECYYYVEIAYQHSQQLGNLISELFELSKLENNCDHLSFEAFSLSELAHDICQKYKLKADHKGLTLTTDIPKEPAFVSADIALIQRVIENLIDNAIKYTPSGGNIQLSVCIADNKVNTTITDTGQGIDEKNLPHIFERFYQVDKHRNSEGSGLGLAISKRILQLHNSHIEVHSQKPQGTAFSFSLSSSRF